MASNIIYSSDIGASAEGDQPNDDIEPNDPNDGKLYDVNISKKTSSSISVVFKTNEIFKNFASTIRDKYEFKQNKSKTGIETTFDVDSKKCNLVLYSQSKRLHIQGSTCRAWVDTTFKELSNTLVNTKDKCATPNRDEQAPYQTPPTSRRPTEPPKSGNILQKIKQTLFSPRTQETSDGNINVIQSPSVLTSSISETPTIGKQHVKSPIIDNTVIDITDCDATQTETTTSSPSPSAKSNTSTENIDYKPMYEKLLTMNRTIQEECKDLINASKLLKEENAQLKSKTAEIKNVQAKYVEVCKSNEKLTSEIRTLKVKLADANSKVMILEEEKNKLVQTQKKAAQEKTQLVGELMSSRTMSESVDDKIESKFNELRSELLNEIKSIKQQIGINTGTILTNSEHSTSTNMPNTNVPGTNFQQANTTANNVIPTQPRHDRTPVYVSGDSIVGVLSAKIMSDNSLNVSVKTNRGGTVETIQESLLNVAHDKPNYICGVKAVVLHVGTNDVSNATSMGTITEKYDTLTDTVQQINPEAKIVISSILPRRRNTLTNNAIDDANNKLKHMCQVKNYHFLDNTSAFKQGDVTNGSLYKDDLHLNSNGARILGNNITRKVKQVLGIPMDDTQHDTSGSGRQPRNFTKERFSGRRVNNNPMMPPWMPFYPPWYPPQSSRRGWQVPQ
ncbi:MAG: GDSL-type esterase/lipase family protein [Sedimenticola sp.]